MYTKKAGEGTWNQFAVPQLSLWPRSKLSKLEVVSTVSGVESNDDARRRGPALRVRAYQLS